MFSLLLIRAYRLRPSSPFDRRCMMWRSVHLVVTVSKWNRNHKKMSNNVDVRTEAEVAMPAKPSVLLSI